MEDIKLTVTQAKREETIDKILQLVEDQFEGIEVTTRFTERLLEDTIIALQNRAMDAPIKNINHTINNRG
ncbi:hypothetical protein G8S55_01240 [Clostridium botulinum C]|uniref:hypothetical protein n=1 Tax=Clostridium botulinum TaxID=1491 RepID=UPI001E41624F|nr:hypothetical protein [Clostridium botulinum]MCD3215873.1 hypothetical protein [Clostridium botulinum C]MCD3244341.1 hypothetical protein [Clostridium botulinum C]MCD3260899.1 hypothetical protein [Clostridium botulinum C]